MSQSKPSWVNWFIITTKMTKLLKAAKLAKLAKPMITFVTMSFSAIAYAFWLGPWFSIGFVLMILIHELGHVAALKMRGFPASAPVFIPFVGAVIYAPKMDNRDDEAFVGIGGPVLGTLAALCTWGIWYNLPNKTSDGAVILLMVSYTGLFLNLFNMIPLRPLDGGRVTQAIGSWFRYIGVAALAGLTILVKEPVMLMIWILVLPDVTMLTLKIRAALSVLFWIGMVSLMLLGYSTQPFWVDIMDVLLSFFIVLMTVSFARANVDPAEEDEQRPQLSQNARIMWLLWYTALTLLLFFCMHTASGQVHAVAELIAP